MTSFIHNLRVFVRCKGLGFALLLIGAVTLCGVSGCNKAVATGRTTAAEKFSARKRVTIDVTPVIRENLQSEIELVGTLIPIRKTTVVSEINGNVAEIAPSDQTIEVDGKKVSLPLDIGSHVKEGQVLVRLKDREQRLALAVADANKDRLESELRHLYAWRRAEEITQLEATMEEAKAKADCAKSDRERYDKLVDKKAISEAEYDSAVAEEIRTRAEVKKAEAALAIAKKGPTKEEIEVAKAHLKVAKAEVAVRQDALDKTIIHAPYDGVVTKRYVDVGDRLIEMMNSDILDIVDSRVLFAEVAVPERYQMGMKLGKVARITVAGLGEAINGTIDRINGNIDPKTRTFLIRVTLDNTNQMLKPGGFARVCLPVASAQSTLVVPFSSVSFDAGRPSVFVYKDGRVAKRDVRLGVSNREKYEIISGVSEGELVATGRIAVLNDGLAVETRKKQK